MEILDRFREGFEQPDELPSDKHITVDTDRNIEQTLTETLKEMIRKQFSSP